MEHRRFHRVTCSIPARLTHHGITYHVRLRNLCLRGALLGSDECLMVPIDDTCTLELLAGEDDAPAIITAQVVHAFFSMVGVKFVDFADDAEVRLFRLLKQITDEPEKLVKEWEALLLRNETL